MGKRRRADHQQHPGDVAELQTTAADGSENELMVSNLRGTQDVEMAVPASEMARTDGAGTAKPVGMQIYWNLSSLDLSVREAAVVALVHELTAAQDGFESGGGQGGAEEVLGAEKNVDKDLEKCAPSVLYALRRLVRGLGSSRESARQGFALALATVMGALPVLSGDAVLRIIHANLEVTSSMKKQDARDGLLGRLFGYGAMVRAGRVIGEGSTASKNHLAAEVTQQLFLLAKQKTFLREPAMNVIIELAQRVPLSSTEESMYAAPLFKEWLQGDAEGRSAESLLLALELHEKLPVSIKQNCSLLPDTGDLQDLFKPSHLTRLIPCLKESSSSHPRVHSIWPVLLDLLLPECTSEVQRSANKKGRRGSKDRRKVENNLARFWSAFVDETLLPSSHERKHLAMELLTLILPRLPSPESVSIVLSNTFVRCILDILSSKDTLLHNATQHCLGTICTWAERDDHRRVAVIVALQKNSRGKFDILSKSSTLRNLTGGLTTAASVMSFVKDLEELFRIGEYTIGKRSTSQESSMEGYNKEDETLGLNSVSNGQGDALVGEQGVKGGSNMSLEKSGDSERIWIVEQMCALCRQAKLEPSAARVMLYKEVMQFLTLHSLFNASNASDLQGEGVETFRWPYLPLSDHVRTLCVVRLRGVLVEAQQWVFAQKSRRSESGSGAEKEQPSQDGLVSDADDFALFLAQYCETVQKSSAATLARPVSEEDAKTLERLRQTVSCLSAAVDKASVFEQTKRLLAMRTLLLHLLVEWLLEPGSGNENAAELIICCNKAFNDLPELSALEMVETEEQSESVPPVMDVLLDILLSLLAQSSAPVRGAAEQVFKVFCGDLTNAGMADMLRVIKKVGKAGRHASVVDADEGDIEDEDDVLGDDNSSEEGGNEDEAENDAISLQEDEDKEVEEEEDNAKETVELDKRITTSHKSGGPSQFSKFNNGTLQTGLAEKGCDDDEMEGSESEMSDMDDEAMFRTDALLARMLKLRKEQPKGGNKAAQTQLAHFKFRVLSLLEFFVQKHPSSSLLLVAVQGLLQAFINAIVGSADENGQVLNRLESIMQNKLLKVKKYPRGEDVDWSRAKALLKKTLKLASRSTIKRVRTLAQGCSLWSLKVLQGSSTNIEEKGDEEVLQLLTSSLEEFFVHKKSRLPGSFFAEAFQRHPWLGRSSLRLLIEKSGNARSEFLKFEAMRLLAGVLRPKGSDKGKKLTPNTEVDQRTADALQPHLVPLGKVVLSLLQNPPEKSAYRINALSFCCSCVEALIVLYPQTPLSALLESESILASVKEITVPRKGKLGNSITKLVSLIEKDVDRKPLPSKKRLKHQKVETPSNKLKLSETSVHIPLEGKDNDQQSKKKQRQSSLQEDEIQPDAAGAKSSKRTRKSKDSS